MSDMDSLMQSWVASTSALNASVINSKGNRVKVMDCGIDTANIKTLASYLREQDPTKLQNYDFSRTNDNDNLMRTYVIPVTLPEGQNIDLVVNSKGQDMACVFKDENGKANSFQLTPRMKKEIMSKTMNVQGKIDFKSMENALCPGTIEEIAKQIEDNTLVPKSSQDVVDKVKGKYGNQADIEVIDNKHKFKEDNKQEEGKDTEKGDENKQIPEKVRDEIAKICSENDLKIEDLREVMIVNPKKITEDLENTGISNNGSNVYCLRFRDSGQLNNRVVMVQPEIATVDKRTYDDYMNDYLDEHRGKPIDKNIEDEHDKIYYTDVHGNTTVSIISKEPRDLNCSDKERLQKELKELDDEYAKIRSIPKSQITLEDRAKAFKSINQKRLETFDKYGIKVPEVEREIKADRSIDEEMEKIGKEHAEEREENESQNESQKHDDYNDNDDYDGRDPRENPDHFDPRNRFLN